MDTELQESIKKFRELTRLAHYGYSNPQHQNNTQEQKTANQLFLKICLTLDSMDQILPQKDQEFVLLNLSSLWIFTRVLMEEEVTFSYLFNQSLSDEEKNFRFALYLYHGVIEDYELLKKISTENFNPDESLKILRTKEFQKCEEEKARCKADLEANPFIKKIPKDDDHYRENKILAGKYPKYIKLEKLIIDEYSSDSQRYPQAYAAYKLGSSFIHSSSFALHKLSIFEQNLKEQNYNDLKIVMQLTRIYASKSINLYTKFFNTHDSVLERTLCALTF